MYLLFNIWNGDVPFVILVFAGVSKKVRQWEPPIWRAKCFCKQGAGPHSLHCIFQWKSLGTVTWNNRKCNLPKRQRKRSWQKLRRCEWDHFGLSIQGALDDKQHHLRVETEQVPLRMSELWCENPEMCHCWNSFWIDRQSTRKLCGRWKDCREMLSSMDLTRQVTEYTTKNIPE